MYRIGRTYKIELNNRIFYTGTILSEDEHQILIRTIYSEELVLSKSEIRQSKLVEEEDEE